MDEIDAAASKQLDALIRDLSADDGVVVSTWSGFEDDRIDTARETAGETVVAGFASHQPEFRQQLVAKKLRLMEKRAEHREKQLARLAAAHKQANATIAKLQHDLMAAQEELETAQQELEEERESILKFRGTNGGGDKGAFTPPMVIGNIGKRGNDAEAQRQRELKLQMLLKGAAEAREMLEVTDGLTGDSNGGGGLRRLGLLLKKARAFIRRRLDPFSSDIRQVEARFGYSGASYFRFLAWVIKSFILLALSGVVFLVLHVRYLLEQQWVSFRPTILLVKYRKWRWHVVKANVANYCEFDCGASQQERASTGSYFRASLRGCSSSPGIWRTKHSCTRYAMNALHDAH